jgi:hypothetical protein
VGRCARAITGAKRQTTTNSVAERVCVSQGRWDEVMIWFLTAQKKNLFRGLQFQMFTDPVWFLFSRLNANTGASNDCFLLYASEVLLRSTTGPNSYRRAFREDGLHVIATLWTRTA